MRTTRYLRPTIIALLALAALVAVGAWSGSTPASAATTFTVNSTADPGDGVCDATECTLREAIAATNANPGTDTIAFNIPGSGPHTIRPTSLLTNVLDPVIIDGYTQPGASPNTNPLELGSNAVLQIELDGSLAGFGRGLLLEADGNTVRGLVMNRFGREAIWIRYTDGNVIEGNFIGTDTDGKLDRGNGENGITINSADHNIVGGTTPEARNVISGNVWTGITIVGDTMGNLVQGNYIGTDVSGTIALGNSFTGVSLQGASDNTIGGTAVGAGNVISGNDWSGVRLSAFAVGNDVQGNLIGTDLTGAAALGNGRGVDLSFGAYNTIGGTTAEAGNTIAFNNEFGVRIGGGPGNAILSNSIFGNGSLGIDLVGDGVTPNDAGDVDSGSANTLQNFPVLTSATSGSTDIEGSLNSTANTQFNLEFFSNSACDPSDHGEGETFLGSTTVVTDGTGNVSFTESFGTTVPVGQIITATATDPNDNTSEFSECITVAAAPPVGGIVELRTVTDTPADASGSSSGRGYTAPLAALAAGAVALAAGRWYARKRWLR